MDKKMTAAARAELADAVHDRYAAASTLEKGRILEEFIAATGYHEKSAIRVLNTAPAQKSRRPRKRAPLHDEAVRSALIVPWEASDRVCGKRLKALLPILLPALERNGHLSLAEPPSEDSLDECGHHRSPAARTAERYAEEEACADGSGAAATHQAAYLSRLERSTARQHGDGPRCALSSSQSR